MMKQIVYQTAYITKIKCGIDNNI